MAALDRLPKLEEFQLDQHTAASAKQLMDYATKLRQARKEKAAEARGG